MSEYSLDTSVVASEGLLIPGSVIVYYREYIDYGDPYDAILEGPKSGDTFVAYKFDTNNEGILVPVLYKTEMDNPDFPEYAEEPDLNDQFFYVGTEVVDGVLYDRWRKIELDAGNNGYAVGDPSWDSSCEQYAYTNIIVHQVPVNDEEYLIRGSTLTAIANRIRSFLRPSPDSLYTIDPNITGSVYPLFPDSVTVYYKEFVDYDDDQYAGIKAGDTHEDTFVAYGYLENIAGETVPVLYDTNMDSHANNPDREEPFFYVGTDTIDGVLYDKWRKLETGDNRLFTWGAEAQQYVYTNIIVQAQERDQSTQSAKIFPADMPDKITEVHKTGFIKGRIEGYDAGYTDGANNGLGGGHENSYREGYDEGYRNGEIDGAIAGRNDGIAIGHKEQYDALWDTYQQNGNRVNYEYGFAGRGWTDETFKPKYDIAPTQAGNIFTNTSITDLVQLLDKQGVCLDFSNVSDTSYIALNSNTLTTFPIVDCRKRPHMNYTFSGCANLRSVEKVILKSDGSQTFSANSFKGLSALEEIRFEGLIGKSLEIKDSPLLSEASLDSILTHFKDCTGQTSLVLTVHPDVGARLTAYQQSVASTLNVTIVY